MRALSILFVLFSSLILSACQQELVTTTASTPRPQDTPASARPIEPPPVIAPFSVARDAALHGHLNVALVGDSITEGANIDPARTWAKKFTSELDASVSGTEVHNFALGSRSIRDLINPYFRAMDTDPSDLGTGFGARNRYDTGRDWRVNGKSWLAHIKDSHPDLLVVAFGVNEVWIGNTTDQVLANWKTNLNTLIREAGTWTPTPAIVIVTPLKPSSTVPSGLLSPPPERLDAIAAQARRTAAEDGHTLVDVNRTWHDLLGTPDPVTGITSAPTYTEQEMLGTWPGTWNGEGGGGNGYNHPTELASDVTYLAGMRSVIDALK